MCSTTHVKQSAWSITKCGYSDTVTLQHIENRAAEARNHLRYISHNSHSRSASPIVQGTTMIHYQLQSGTLAFTSVCSSMRRWRGGDSKDAEEVQGDFTVHEVTHSECAEDSNRCMKSSIYV
jgi:hypothetical protein